MENDYKTRVAMYLRKSRMDPDSESIDETLARHTDTLTKFAGRLGMCITGVYKEVVSGDGLFTRPEMVRILQDIERGEYTAVLCMEIDRLGRSSQKDSGIIFETLKENEVFIVTPNKTYNLNDDIDEQSVEMQSFIARQELKSIKRRLRKGAEKSCEFGYHIAEPPYGYRRVYVDRRPTLEICEEEAAVIRMVFDMYVYRNMGSGAIAEELNRMGLRPRESDCFSRSTIMFFLTNPTYTGKIIWNRKRHIRPKFAGDKHRQIANDKDKWIIADGVHPPIISQELFDVAQKIRLTRSHPPSNTGEIQNPFAGLIYCKNCRAAIQRQYSSVSGARLLCVHKSCTRSIKTEYVEKTLVNILYDVLAGCAADEAVLTNDKTDLQAESLENVLRDLEKSRRTLLSQRSNLHDLLERGIYDTDTFIQRNSVISERLCNIDASMAEHSKRLNEINQKPLTKKAPTALTELLSNYDLLTAAEKNALYKMLIVRIEYEHTKEQKRNEFSLDIEWR